MSEYKDRLRSYREATRPSANELARIRASVSAGRTSSPWMASLSAVAGVAAVVAVVWSLRPVEPVPVERHIDTTAQVGPAAVETVAVGDDVRVDVRGQGTVTGTPKDVQVGLVGGKLSVEVTPEQGIQLAVRTDEATVRVIGTGFDVTRDALGTMVEVRHGRVQVDCTDGASTLITAGESRLCLPGTAAGMLGRARALQDGGAAPEVVGDAVQRGLSMASEGPVRAELRNVQLGVEVRAGRTDAALTLAEDMLRSGETLRRAETLQLAARLRVLAADCAGADPWLRELGSMGAVPADDPARTTCPGSFAP